ncbi:major facilitator superfamily transporter [Seiridium cupressi]
MSDEKPMAEIEKGLPSPAQQDPHHFKHAAVSTVLTSNAEERALLWKQDIRIIPLSAAIYFLCNLDRSNIGNARILNSTMKNDMQTELQMTPVQFNIALMIFLIGYFAFEIPSNIMLKKMRPSQWIAFLMLSWGAITIGLGGTHNFSQVTGVRFLLGAFEAGLFPGLVYYLTFWYKSNERSVRVAFILASATLAGAFGGAIAYGIGHINQASGFSGWRWLFIIEGIPSCLSALAVWFILPDFPESAGWLSQQEKDLAISRLQIEGSKGDSHSLTWAGAKATLTDWRLYGHYLIYFAVSLPFSSLSLFTPTITAGLGYKDLQAQLMTVPPWAVAYVAQILVSWSADHFNARGLHCAGAAFVGAIAFLASAAAPANAYAGRYVCLIIGSAGAFSSIPPMLGWLTSNMWDTAATGLAVALNVSIGAGIGQIPGVWIYKSDEAALGYPTGHGRVRSETPLRFLGSTERTGTNGTALQYAISNPGTLCPLEIGQYYPMHELCKTNTSAVEDTLTNYLPSNASIERLSYVEAGSTYGDGALDLMYPVQPTDLPELCAVTVYVQSSASSWYRFGIFFPADWNSRFLAIGNGGFGGGINWLDMGSYVKYGFSVTSTDTGHNSTKGSAWWAYEQPEKRTDWGWRALNGTIGGAKRMIERYYETSITYSYYNGCSNGGRQGLRQIGVDPDSFDGLVIGAAGWYTSHLNPWITRVGVYNLPETAPYHIDWRLFPAMANLVVQQCDKLDGVKDGVISMPEACVPDYSEMLCTYPGANQSACSTEDQVQTPGRVYSDYLSSTGQPLYPGLSPGCEGQWQAVLSFTETSDFDYNYIRHFLLDNLFWNYTYWSDDLFTYAAETDPGQATANNYDLSTFRDLGHKMVMYHGLGDGLIPPRGSDMYYSNVMKTMGSNLTSTQDWFRYFQVPSMQHCWSTETSANGPWAFGAEFQATHLGSDQWSVPGFQDKDHDILMALVDWVENGNPIDSVIATTWNQPLNASSGLKSQRPLCPWPQVALYNEHGDVNVASSWSCGTRPSNITRTAAKTQPPGVIEPPNPHVKILRNSLHTLKKFLGIED